MIYQQFCQCLFFFVTWLMRSLDWSLRTTMIHDIIACYFEAYFSMLSSWRFDSDTLVSQFPTFSATIMIISYDNDILIFDMNSVIKIISRYYHSIITKISVKYQNINNQTNDILSWYFDKPQYCTLVILSELWRHSRPIPKIRRGSTWTMFFFAQPSLQLWFPSKP